MTRKNIPGTAEKQRLARLLAWLGWSTVPAREYRHVTTEQHQRAVSLYRKLSASDLVALGAGIRRMQHQINALQERADNAYAEGYKTGLKDASAYNAVRDEAHHKIKQSALRAQEKPQ